MRYSRFRPSLHLIGALPMRQDFRAGILQQGIRVQKDRMRNHGLAAGFGLSHSEIAAAMEHIVAGAVRTLLASGPVPADVMDLVPVKPLAEIEPQVTEMYGSRLQATCEKIKA